MQQQDNHEYPFLYQRQTCHQVQPNQATYQKRQKCQPATYLQIPMLCVTIFVILVVWFLLPRVARLMIHTPTAISIFVCLSMVQLMAVFISMRCTLCGHFLQVALTLILVVGYAIAAS